MRKSLRSRIFFSFSLFAVCMTGFLLIFVWMSYEAGQESATQKLLEAQATAFLKDPTQPLPNTEVLKGYIGTGQMPPTFRNHLEEFEIEDYEVPIREWQEIQLWQSELPNGGGTFYLFLDLRETADQAIFLPNALRALLIAGVTGLFLLLVVSAGISTRLTRPLNALVEDVDAIKPGHTTEPLSPRHPQGDTARLAQAFDRLLERIHTFMNREKRFTRNASHELRTPITLIQSATENLKRSIPDPQPVQQRALQHLQWGARDMSQSVETFLALAREESEPEPPFHGWEALLEDCVQSQQVHRQDDRIKIHVDVSGAPNDRIPPRMIRAIVNNLLRNALQHTREGMVTVVLDAETLEISDTGPGIPEEHLNPDTGLPVGKGAHSDGEGLGLRIVQEICLRYDWTLCLQTDPSGSKFTVFLQK